MRERKVDEIFTSKTKERAIKGRFNLLKLNPARGPLKILSKIVDKVLLDVGCGEGTHSLSYLRQGAEVVAVDIDGQILKKLHACARNCQKLHIIVADSLHLPFRPHVFDIIIAIEVIEHVNDSYKFIFSCYKALKTEGLFVLSTPNAIIERTLVKIINPLYVLSCKLLKKPLPRGDSFMEHINCLTYSNLNEILKIKFTVTFVTP